ncbi:glycoside hydrolase [Labilibacter sediminis]|nr:glycoside hydrolase [Labilibacter sediminis]
MGKSINDKGEMIKKIAILIILCVCCLGRMHAQDYRTVKNLGGSWKFALGDNDEWSSVEYDDSGWETIVVPSSWERHGFNGYDGYAWYRTKVVITNIDADEALYLELGYIDDADEVYFNGVKIGGAGSFPPQAETAYNALRLYGIPDQLIKYDEINQIAVKVYDMQYDGGIVRGPVRLKAKRNPFSLHTDLQGNWSFRVGDDLDWRFSDASEGWDEILVPGLWENQGYRKYDGYAWYQKFFVPDTSFNNDRMVLMLGRIDDIDEVYVNGILIGQTGSFTPEEQVGVYTEAYRQLRGYLIPQFLIQPGVKNTIHVRVLDFMKEGGIVEGPVGFIRQQDYIQYWQNRKKYR